MAGIINTPSNDSHRILSDNFEAPDFTQIDSFRAPNDDLIKASKKRAGTHTPRRQIFGDRTNKPKGEFTPLLKSVHKSKLEDKVRAAVERTPMFMKYANENSLQLPKGDSSGFEGSSYNSGDSTPMAAQMLSSSEAGTPLPMVRGKGVLDDGQLTLREQEKIIDDIKKENWSLKLKIHFLDEKMGKLGPEYNNAAIKENADLKVEHVQLKENLKRYKKQLFEAERTLNELQQETLGMQQNAQQKYVDTKQADKDARKLQDALDELARKEEELEALSEENEQLKREAEDRNKTEQEDMEEIESLRQQIRELQEDKEKLEVDLRAKEGELDERKDSKDEENEKLRERLEEVESELQAKVDNEEDHEEALNRERDRVQVKANELQEEVDDLARTLEQKEDDMNAILHDHEERVNEMQDRIDQAGQKIKSLHNDKQTLQQKISTLENERDGDKFELGDKLEQLEHQNAMLKDQLEDTQNKANEANAARKKLEDDLAVLKETHKEQMDELRETIRERSLTMKSRVQERDENRQRLQKELEKVQHGLANMTKLHNEKSQETDLLSKRVYELTNNFDGDFKALQIEITTLRGDKERSLRDQAELRAQKEVLQIRHNSLATESQQLQADLIRMENELEEAREMLNHEKDDAITTEQALHAELAMEKERLEETIEKLHISIDDKARAADRNADNWNSEKRQMELKLTREINRVQGLEAQIASLREFEGSVHGKEMHLVQELDKEKLRHSSEVDNLHIQIAELSKDLKLKKSSLENNSSELQKVKDELRQARKSEKEFRARAESLDEDLHYITQTGENELQDAREKAAVAEDKCNRLRDELKQSKDALLQAQTQLRREQSNLRAIEDDAMTGNLSQQQLGANLEEAERQLNSVKRERQQLRDQLATSNSQLKSLRAQCDDIEVERGQQVAEIEGLSRQLASTSKQDNEKQELRKAKARLEAELKQLNVELDTAVNAADDMEIQLEEAVKAAVGEEKKLEAHIKKLKGEISDVTSIREREQNQAKREVARLEQRIQELQEQQHQIHADALEELSMIRTDLVLTKQREQEMVQREQATKEKVRDLKVRVQRLEAELHDARLARPRSPNDTQAQIERQELHSHLMNARLQIEELQTAIDARENELRAQAARETEITNEVRSLRDDRKQAVTNAKKTEQELSRAHQRLQRLQDKLVGAQENWEAEKKRLIEQVRVNASPERILIQSEPASAEAEKRHRAEMKGLAKQIIYLRAKITREEGFRNDLCFTKNFFMMQINLYGSCNQANLQMLEQMGIFPDQAIREKRPTLRTAGLAVIAAIRMKNRQQEWSKNETLKRALAKSLDKVRQKSSRRQ